MQSEKPLGYILGQTAHVFKNKVIEKFKENKIGISFDHFIILHHLSLEEDLTQQDLANYLQKDKSIILRQINTLLNNRYVVRLPDKVDRRKKNLILTKKGVELLAFAKELGKTISDELLKGISQEEFDIFQKVMDKIQENGGFNESSPNC